MTDSIRPLGRRPPTDDRLPEMPNDENHPFAFGRPIRLDAEQTAMFRRMAAADPPDWFVKAVREKDKDDA